MNCKGADQAAGMCRLICAFVVRIWLKRSIMLKDHSGTGQRIVAIASMLNKALFVTSGQKTVPSACFATTGSFAP